jgi:biopolymer transport protein ExbB/TolQ
MVIQMNIVIIIALIVVIPALCVLTISLLRIETVRGDAKSIRDNLVSINTEYTRITNQFETYADQISTLSASVHAAGLRMSAIEESVTSVNNKLASRERAERGAMRRRGREEDDEADQVPTKQQELDLTKLPGVIPLPSRRIQTPPPVAEHDEDIIPFGQLPQFGG